jgi:hypothetical protein
MVVAITLWGPQGILVHLVHSRYFYHLPSIIYYPLPFVYQFTTQVYKMDQKAQYTVLRIKRKATEPPLSSLGT